MPILIIQNAYFWPRLIFLGYGITSSGNTLNNVHVPYDERMQQDLFITHCNYNISVLVRRFLVVSKSLHVI